MRGKGVAGLPQGQPNLVIQVGMSKRDLTKRRANLKERIAHLEIKARMDPLKKKYPEVHEELDKLKKELEQS